MSAILITQCQSTEGMQLFFTLLQQAQEQALDQSVRIRLSQNCLRCPFRPIYPRIFGELTLKIAAGAVTTNKEKAPQTSAGLKVSTLALPLLPNPPQHRFLGNTCFGTQSFCHVLLCRQ